MRRQGLGWLAAGLLVAAAVSCFKDPTSSLQGSATRLVLSTTFANLTTRPDTTVLFIQAQDNQGNYQSFAAPTFSSVDPTIATIVAFPDTVIGVIPGNTLWKALIVGGATPGNTKITVTAAGVTDTISVSNLPFGFQGTFTPANAHSGDTITVTAPAGLTFSATASVAFAPAPTFLVSRSASVLKYIAAATQTSQNYTVSGLLLNGNPLTALTSLTPISVTDVNEPANDTSAGAVNMGTLNASGDSLVVYSSINGSEGGSDPSGSLADYWKFTLTPTDSVNVNLSFNGAGTPGTDANPDLDVVICTSLVTGRCTYGNDKVIGNGSSGTVNPEHGSTTLLTGPATVFVRVYGYFATGNGITGYRLRIKAL